MEMQGFAKCIDRPTPTADEQTHIRERKLYAGR